MTCNVCFFMNTNYHYNMIILINHIYISLITEPVKLFIILFSICSFVLYAHLLKMRIFHNSISVQRRRCRSWNSPAGHSACARCVGRGELTPTSRASCAPYLNTPAPLTLTLRETGTASQKYNSKKYGALARSNFAFLYLSNISYAQ